jgi:hypothetical protein
MVIQYLRQSKIGGRMREVGGYGLIVGENITQTVIPNLFRDLTGQ